MTSGAEERRSAIFNAGRWNTVGQEEKARRRINDDNTSKTLEMEQDDVIKVYQEQTGGGEEDMVRPVILPDQIALRMKPGTTIGPEKEKPETRLRASEVNLDATAMTKQEHVDDCSGDGHEDGVVKQKELSRRQVDSSFNRIVNSLGLRTPITVKYEIPLQKLVKTGLEWIGTLQGNLAEEVAAVRQEVKQKKELMKHLQKAGVPEDRARP